MAIRILNFSMRHITEHFPVNVTLAIWSVFTHVASPYANLLEQKKAFA